MSKRIVKALNFETEGAHVALVGRGANKQEVLLMKQADELQITTSMHSFLQKYFRLYHKDAQELNKLLRVDSQEWMVSILGDDENVEILKNLEADGIVSKELYRKIETMEANFNLLEKEGKNMKKEAVEKKEIDLQKSIDDAVKIALVKAESEKVKAIAAKDLEITNLKKAEDVRIKNEYVELAKGYSFVEDAEALATTLFKCRDIKGFEIILTTLEKARNAMKEALEGEVGTDEEATPISVEVPTHLSKTAALIKARYNKENK